MWTSPGCRGDIGSDLTARLGLRLCLGLGLLEEMDSWGILECVYISILTLVIAQPNK